MSYNYFNPQGGPSYGSQQGLLGYGAPGFDFGSIGNPWAGIGNGLFNIFGAEDPSKAANPFLNDIEGSMGKYMSPYINAGLGALPKLQGQYDQLINNPGDVMNRLGSGFQQSPGYQFQVDQALGAANRASAAGGMAGTPQEQQQIAGTVNQLANQDYGNYMNRAMGMYDQGLSGLSNLYGTGFNASSTMANGLMQELMAKAMAAYSGAANRNQSMGGGIGGLLGGIGSLAGLGGLF